MSILYRCNECGKEVEEPIRLRLVDWEGDTIDTYDACGPDDAIRLAAPVIRNGRTLGSHPDRSAVDMTLLLLSLLTVIYVCSLAETVYHWMHHRWFTLVISGAMTVIIGAVIVHIGTEGVLVKPLRVVVTLVLCLLLLLWLHSVVVTQGYQWSK